MGVLSGKVAIVTGAGSGIGLATARRLAADGAWVLAAARTAGQPQENGNMRVVAADVTDADAPERIVGAAVQAFGGVDILVNNAGIAPVATLDDSDAELLHKVMAVNVEAVLRLSQRAVVEMRKRGGGRIINIGSVTTFHAVPMCAAYGISKHAVASLTKSMCLEWGGDGITANYVCPGAIVTGITEAAYVQGGEFRAFWQEKALLKRWGQPDDIAAPIAFLASDDAAFITGHGLVVDGGAMLQF